jgi:hypothetical protein
MNTSMPKTAFLAAICSIFSVGILGCSNAMESTDSPSNNETKQGKSDRFSPDDSKDDIERRTGFTVDADKDGSLYLYGTAAEVIDNLIEKADENYQAATDEPSNSGPGTVGGYDIRSMYNDVLESGAGYLVEDVHGLNVSRADNEILATASSKGPTGMYKLLELMIIADDENDNVDGINLEANEATSSFGPIACQYNGQRTTCSFSSFDNYNDGSEKPELKYDGKPELKYEFSEGTTVTGTLTGTAASHIESFLAEANELTDDQLRETYSSISCAEAQCTLDGLTRYRGSLPATDAVELRSSRTENEEPKGVEVLFKLLKRLENKPADTRDVEGDILDCTQRRRQEPPNFVERIQTECSVQPALSE